MQFLFPQFAQHVSRHVRRPKQREVDHGLANRRQVHDQVQPHCGRDEKKVLELLARGPATRYEISVALDMAYTTVSARVADLKAKCLVRDTAIKRPTATGSMACVVELVQ